MIILYDRQFRSAVEIMTEIFCVSSAKMNH